MTLRNIFMRRAPLTLKKYSREIFCKPGMPVKDDAVGMSSLLAMGMLGPKAA